MQTGDILKKCGEIPGVSLKKEEEYMELCLERPDGAGKMVFYELFPGILLAYIRVNAPVWPAPDLQSFTPNDKGPLLINYCVAGRCELVLNNDMFVYLRSKELSLTQRYAQTQYVYPGKFYEGIEIFLDMETVREQVPYIGEAFQIDLEELPERYCPDGGIGLFACEGEAEEHARALWRLEERQGPSAVLQRRTETLALLGLLLCGDAGQGPGNRVFFTAAQVHIAKETERIIMEDLRRHYPARELAERFSVSETSLKNYFRGVYGQNLSVYLREMRMNRAAELLVQGGMSVSEIAESVGYLNQSKFAAVFRRRFRMSPLEYRRTKRLEIAFSGPLCYDRLREEDL